MAFDRGTGTSRSAVVHVDGETPVGRPCDGAIASDAQHSALYELLVGAASDINTAEAIDADAGEKKEAA